MDSSRKGIRQEILKLEQLPPLSTTASELVRVVGDPDLEVKQLADIISQDPPLTARLLGLANSAFYGQANPVLTVEEAIIRVLGLNVVRSLALSMALAGGLNTDDCPAYDAEAYWQLALGTASLARDMAVAERQPDRIHPDAAYLCGLLHTLGELALVHLLPEAMNAVFKEQQRTPDADRVTLERMHLGIDCWHAGELLASRWQLPEPVAQTMRYLATDRRLDADVPVAVLVAKARTWMLAVMRDQVVTTGDEQFNEVATELHGRMGELRALAAAVA